MEPPPPHRAVSQCPTSAVSPDLIAAKSTAGRCRVAWTPRPDMAAASLKL